MKKYDNGLIVTEKEDVIKLFENLSPWEQRELLVEFAWHRGVFPSREEALNYFGFSVPSITDYSAWEVVDNFDADDLLEEIGTYEIIEYINSTYLLRDDVLEDIGTRYIARFICEDEKRLKEFEEDFQKEKEKLKKEC